MYHFINLKDFWHCNPKHNKVLNQHWYCCAGLIVSQQSMAAVARLYFYITYTQYFQWCLKLSQDKKFNPIKQMRQKLHLATYVLRKMIQYYL